ncbi:MAG: radical SAM protein [Pyrinomonadaceae bacterium]|nr:radical SAM protein [Pyrinomonadaceae bacterium]
MTPAQHPIPSIDPSTAAPRMSIELTNICNLHCSYCLRDEDDLYHSSARFFPPDLLRKIVSRAKETYGVSYVSFTGGEVTIHPQFEEIVAAVAGEGVQISFVTNGWHFDRVYPVILRHREAVRLVAFSLDGATREAHDHWRGAGSFIRVVRAMTRCHASNIKFILKVGIRRDTVPQLQSFALFAARLGAAGLHFAHLLPTSAGMESESGLSLQERLDAEQEISIISNIFKMPVGIVTGYYNVDPSAPCAALLGKTCNVDFHGRLTLCCNLSGYRGADDEPDVVADLTKEDFAVGYERLGRVAEEQNERRRKALASFETSGGEVDLYTSSPCLFCLQSFGKTPWRTSTNPADLLPRSLPVIQRPANAT